MTNDLVLDLARAHLAASLLILVVLAVRRTVRSLVGPRVAYALWLLPLIAAFAVLLPARIDYKTAAPAAPAPVVQTFAASVQASPIEAVPAAPLALDPWQAVLALWTLGVAVSLAWLLVQQVRYLSFARRGEAGPAVVGFWRPKVVLPVDFEDRYSVQERALILAHEATHLKRQDPRVIGLALTLRSLAWFNPLAYIAVTKLRIDQELACDETVVSRFPKARRAYADALAKSQLAIRPLPLGCYWPSGTEHPLLERLSMLKASRIGPRGRLVGAAALTVLAAATGLAAWAATPAQVRYLPAAPSRAAVAPPSAPLADIHVARPPSPHAGRREAARVELAQAAPASAPSSAPAAVQYDSNLMMLIRGTLLGVDSSGPHPMASVQTDACVACDTPARIFQVEVARLKSGTPGAQANVRVGETVTMRGFGVTGVDYKIVGTPAA